MAPLNETAVLSIKGLLTQGEKTIIICFIISC